MIGVIDYGAGNLKSIQNAFDFIGAKIKLTSNADELYKFDRLILPGVGAFSDAMSNLKKLNLDEAIKEFVKTGKPILGICLGLQLFFEKSAEFGKNEGLGILKGEVVKFSHTKNQNLKIPHTGWNSLNFQKKSKLIKDLKQNPYFYFVHSYHAKCEEDIVLAKTFYGYEFVSAICKDNIFALQPHPEKSSEFGIKLLRNFTEI